METLVSRRRQTALTPSSRSVSSGTPGVPVVSNAVLVDVVLVALLSILYGYAAALVHRGGCRSMAGKVLRCGSEGHAL